MRSPHRRMHVVLSCAALFTAAVTLAACDNTIYPAYMCREREAASGFCLRQELVCPEHSSLVTRGQTHMTYCAADDGGIIQ